ncbi:MAG: 2-oxoacid:acceptor oxidoreductase family protein [Candidatus Zixiibacteriota bacterium]|nr:MAG: 2-oxoacid:acceptor oxidoreductase family protein [candidate division Zixibacteria bacterium]
MFQGIIMSGFGGQGIISGGIMLAYAGMIEGKQVTFFPAYGAEMRGGTANCSVVISSDPVASPVVGNPDSLLIMNEPSLARFEDSLKPDGLMIINSSLVASKPTRTDIAAIEIPVSDLAEGVGNIKTANMVILGAYARKTGAVSIDGLKNSIEKVYVRASASMVEMNKKAIDKGAEAVS